MNTLASQIAFKDITKYRNEIELKYIHYQEDWFDFGYVGRAMLNTKEIKKLNKLILKK
jgi:hypothetical protein